MKFFQRVLLVTVVSLFVNNACCYYAEIDKMLQPVNQAQFFDVFSMFSWQSKQIRSLGKMTVEECLIKHFNKNVWGKLLISNSDHHAKIKECFERKLIGATVNIALVGNDETQITVTTPSETNIYSSKTHNLQLWLDQFSDGKICSGITSDILKYYNETPSPPAWTIWRAKKIENDLSADDSPREWLSKIALRELFRFKEFIKYISDNRGVNLIDNTKHATDDQGICIG